MHATCRHADQSEDSKKVNEVRKKNTSIHTRFETADAYPTTESGMLRSKKEHL
jgi:hypothetical protein